MRNLEEKVIFMRSLEEKVYKTKDDLKLLILDVV
jgi:hypothetical protein